MTVGRSTSPTHQRGAYGEAQALVFVQTQGLQLLAQNWHSRYGEIDLILQQQQTLIFAEVKLRQSNAYGGAVAAVTPAKQRKIIATAHDFLQQHPQYDAFDCRFDVLAVSIAHRTQPPLIEWIQAAFASD